MLKRVNWPIFYMLMVVLFILEHLFQRLYFDSLGRLYYKLVYNNLVLSKCDGDHYNCLVNLQWCMFSMVHFRMGMDVNQTPPVFISTATVFQLVNKTFHSKWNLTLFRVLIIYIRSCIYKLCKTEAELNTKDSCRFFLIHVILEIAWV